MSIYPSNLKFKAGILFVFLALMMPTEQLQAQRMGHPVSRGGRQSVSRPANRPAATPRPATTNRTSSSTINGGRTQSNTRDFSNTDRSNTQNKSARPATSDRTTTGKSRISDNKASNAAPKLNNTDKRTSNIKTNDVKRGDGVRGSGNNINSGNINIDNSKNLNINRGNTYVRPSHIHYVRPPYYYGGFHYYCHRPYYYHPYTPYYWGPVWHPWGYFVTTMATTAIIVSIVNDNSKDEYHYDNGTYYLKTPDGFVAVQAPIGAEVSSLPKEAQEVSITETTNNYYYGGAFYEKNAEGYIVVPATAGTIVPGLPEGGEEVKIGEVTYVQFGDTYYQPIQVDGKNMYEIVEVKAE